MFHSCFQHLRPAALLRVSSQGKKSGKDSQISGPVGALIKFPGSHSGLPLVSESVPTSSDFCLLFCFEGQRVDSAHFGSLRCGGSACICCGQGPHSPAARGHRLGDGFLEVPCCASSAPHLLPPLVGRGDLPRTQSGLLASGFLGL